MLILFNYYFFLGALFHEAGCAVLCCVHQFLVVLVKQLQAQTERADNCALRADNDKIRCENIVIREALKNVICPSCGGPPLNDESYFDEQKLRLENAQLKEEVIE